MKIRLAIAALLLAACLPAPRAGAADYPRDEHQVYGMLSSHGWKDFNLNDGSALADDKGFSGGIGWEGQFESDSYRGYWRPRVQAYYGKSDYKEKTASGDLASTTDLFGMSAGVDYLLRIPAGQSFAFEPVLGMALRMDRRLVGGGSAGSAADNTLVVRERYREQRHGLMGRVGLRGVVGELGGSGDERSLADFEARHLFLEGGLLLPVYMDYQGGINGKQIATGFHPGFYFEAGGRIGRWQPAVYYEGMRYDNGGSKQAQSDVVGARLGVRF